MNALARWALRRAVALEPQGPKAGGLLVWVGPDGEAHSLGRVSPAQLEALAWATGVAYRATRVRWERTRLAGLRAVASQVVVAARALPRPEGEGPKA